MAGMIAGSPVGISTSPAPDSLSRCSLAMAADHGARSHADALEVT